MRVIWTFVSTGNQLYASRVPRESSQHAEAQFFTKMRQILTLRFPALLALLCIPLISFAQTNLAADGNTHTINKVGSNNRTGGYQDFLIPSSLGAYDHIEFFLKGGDGGRRKVKNECRVEGGKGGNNGVNGLPGVGQSVNGGENGEPGGGSSSCGGGGLVSRTTCGADGGHLTGGNGQSGAQNGGFGYGAGSAGDHVGGGGGGYSGGGDGANLKGGGGGGSFASPQAVYSQKVKGSTTGSPNSGFITYTFKDEDPFAPTPVCQDITVQLNASGSVTFPASQSDGGSTDPQGLGLTYSYASISGSPASVTWDCTNLGENIETLSVSNGSVEATCTSIIFVEENNAPTAICQDITVYSDASGMASFAASDINNGSNDQCAGTDLSLSLDVTTALVAESPPQQRYSCR